MRSSRFVSIFGYLIAAVMALPSAAERTLERLSEAIWSGFAYVVRAVAQPVAPHFAGGPAGLSQSIGSYVSPRDREIKHESTVHQRSAARHV